VNPYKEKRKHNPSSDYENLQKYQNENTKGKELKMEFWDRKWTPKYVNRVRRERTIVVWAC
jgi:hypothetical protein